MKKISIMSVLVLFTVIGMAFAALSGPAPIPNPPTFTLGSNVTVLCKGETNYIPISVTNGRNTNPSIGLSNPSGTSMQYILLSLASSKTLIPAGNATAYIGNLNPGTSNTAYLSVFVAANASLITSVEVGITYYYLELYADSETRNLTFEVVSCPSPLSVSIEPKTLASGQIQNLSINLTNSGNTTLTGVYVHFTVPSADGAIIGPAQSVSGSMAPMVTRHIIATLFVSRNASIESFPFNLTATFYNGKNIEQVANSTSLIPVGAINLLPSGMTLSPATTSPGGIFSISFVLTDIGTSGASAVTVAAIPPQGFTPFGANPVYVGDIGADAQAPVTVTLTTGAQVKSGNYTIPLKINYLNSLRQNVSGIINVSVSVGGSASGLGALNSTRGAAFRTANPLLGLIIPLLVVIIIVLAVLLYREIKKNKRHPK